MKKLTALLLVFLMALSLCGCGTTTEERYPELADMLDAGDYEDAVLYIYEMYEADQEDGGSDHDADSSEDQVRAEPTEEDWRELTVYAQIVEMLENGYSRLYLEGNWYDGQDAYQYCYERLHELESVDKWVGTLSSEELDNYLGYYGQFADRDRQTLLDSFTILPDKPLSRRVWYEDALGNINEQNTYFYTYSTDGALTSPPDTYNTFYPGINYPCDTGTPERTFDENGQLTQLRYLVNEDEVNCVITYTYNADGTLSGEDYLDRNAYEFHITYTYEDGRLAAAEGMPWKDNYGTICDVTYTYDESGNLVEEHYAPDADDSWKYDGQVLYTYDGDGKCVSIVSFWVTTYRGKVQSYTGVTYYTYSYDDTGRLIQSTSKSMDNYNGDGESTYARNSNTYISDYTYGDYYAYTPAE